MEVRRARRWATAAVAAAMTVAMTAGCGSSSESGAASTSGSSGATETVQIVAATNVWGDVAKQVAGSLAGTKVDITSIITDPDTDPHDYQASPQNQLALSKAKLVIENGGGYDDFVATMLTASKNTGAKVLNAVDISGKKAPAGGDLNEHVWYDFPTTQKVATEIASTLAAVDPSDASTYRSNAEAFNKTLDGLKQTEADIKSAHKGAGVAITEPVPLYMLQACGLVNKTPEQFSEAIEDGTDASPTVLAATQKIFDTKQVKLLAYNEQTTGAQTEAVLKAAKSNNIPVVGVTETLPQGKDYVTWMQANLAAIQKALA